MKTLKLQGKSTRAIGGSVQRLVRRNSFDQRSASNGKSGLVRVAPAVASEKMRVKTSLDFGMAIRRARTAAGLSLPALAVKARLPKSLISTIENGKGNPSLSTLHKLSWALGVQITINERQTHADTFTDYQLRGGL